MRDIYIKDYDVTVSFDESVPVSEIQTALQRQFPARPVPHEEGSSVLRRAIADPAISALKGAVGLPESLVGLADIPTGGLIGKALESIGYKPKEAKKTLDSWYSPEQQEANRKVQEVEGFTETLKTSLQNPSTIVHSVIESAPSMIGGGAIGRGALRAVPRISSAIAGAIGEGAISAGQTEEQARQESKTGTTTAGQSLIAAGSGALTGLFGVIGGKLASRLGISDVDTLLAGGSLAAPVKAEAKKKVLLKLAGAALSEGTFEELPQSTQERIAQNIATGRPWDEGVANSMATGWLVGSLMGVGGESYSQARASFRKNDLVDIPDTKIGQDDITVDQAIQEASSDVFTEGIKSDMLNDLLSREMDVAPETVQPGSTANAKGGRYDAIIDAAAQAHGVDPALVRSVIRAESGFKNGQTSSAGAGGLMQLMPDTAKGLGVKNVMDPAQNINAGTKYLGQLLAKYDGDVNKALAAYNWGPGNLDKHGIENAPKVTRDYIAKVRSGKTNTVGNREGINRPGSARAAAEVFFGPDAVENEIALESLRQRGLYAPEETTTKSAEESARVFEEEIEAEQAENIKKDYSARKTSYQAPIGLLGTASTEGFDSLLAAVPGAQTVTQPPREAVTAPTYTATKDSAVFSNVQPNNIENLKAQGFTLTENKPKQVGISTEKGEVAAQFTKTIDDGGGTHTIFYMADGSRRGVVIDENGETSRDVTTKHYTAKDLEGEDLIVGVERNAITGKVDTFFLDEDGKRRGTTKANPAQTDEEIVRAGWDDNSPAKQVPIPIAPHKSYLTPSNHTTQPSIVGPGASQGKGLEVPVNTGVSAAKGRDLFSKDELKAFDRLNIDVSGVTEQYKAEALQQIDFEKRYEGLSSEEYNAKIRQAYADIETRRNGSSAAAASPIVGDIVSWTTKIGKPLSGTVTNVEEGKVKIKTPKGNVYTIKTTAKDFKAARPDAITGTKETLLAETKERMKAKEAEQRKGPLNLIGRLAQKDKNGRWGIKWGQDYNAKEMRQYPDGRRVSNQKTGIPADEWVAILNAEGYNIASGDDLVELVKSGQARDIYPPEKSGMILDRKVKEYERESWERAEAALADLIEAEGIDPRSISESEEHLEEFSLGEIESEEGLSQEELDAAQEDVEDFFTNLAQDKPAEKTETKETAKEKTVEKPAAAKTAELEMGAAVVVEGSTTETAQSLRYEPSTDRYNGEKLSRGDILTDKEGNRYALDRANGFILTATKLNENNQAIGDESFSVDSSDKVRFRDFTKTGGNLYSEPAGETIVRRMNGSVKEKRQTQERPPLPQKSIDMMDKAIAEHDLDKLYQMVHPANPSWRKQFTERTGVQLPKGVNASEQAVGEWAESSKATEPTAAKEGIQDFGAATAKTFDDFFSRAREGDITPDELKAAFNSLVENKDSILEELAGLTKDALLKRMGGMAAYRYKNDKKGDIVRAAYQDILSDFVLGRGIQYNPFEGKNAYENALQKMVDATTERDIQDFAKRVADQREEYKQRIVSLRKAIDNPETLDEFKQFIKAKGKDALSPEQRRVYDDLVSDNVRETKAAQAERKAEVQGAGIVATSDIIETKHTKKGHDLFVVQLSDRVERDIYNKLNIAAKKIGGYYSSFKGSGAIPGFQFTTREQAEAFHKLANEGNTQVATEVSKEKKELRVSEKETKAVERMRAIADRMAEKANESLSRDRLANTARRARMASSAEDVARHEIQIAETMRNIADAIESGEAKHLSGLRTKTQVALLNGMVRTAKRNELSSKYNTYGEQEKHKHDPATEETADFISPTLLPELYKENIRDLLKRAAGKKGIVRLVEKWEKRAGTSGDYYKVKNTGELDELTTIAAATREPFNRAEMIADSKRLRSMGIESSEMERAAVREFIKFRAGRRKADKAKELERSLIGKNVGVDFFPTPKATAQRMVEKADIQEGMSVLEPSAGNGNIAETIRESGIEPDVVEVSSSLRDVLEVKGFNLVGQDFMDTDGQYDRIIMNPPFSKNQDIEHVQHAFDLLKPGGRLVAIMGEGAFFRNDKAAAEFREWLNEVDGIEEKLPEGTFTDRTLMNTTGVNARLVVIDKPAQGTAPQYSRKGSSVVTPEQDAAYLKAVESGDMETAQRMVAEAAQRSGLPLLDSDEQLSYSYRRGPTPKKTRKAYKLFKMRDGKLYPLFIGANSPVETGAWLDAKGENFFLIDNRGRKRVPAKTGNWTTMADGKKMKTLAFRPGWHSGDMPYAIQIAPKNGHGQASRYENDVWAEIEISADNNYTQEALSNASTTKKGTVNAREAQLAKVPKDGFYPYKTNSNAEGEWFISGAIKVNKVLTEDEVNGILQDHGITPMPWIGGRQNLGKFGVKAERQTNQAKLLDPVTYDDDGNTIPLSERFNEKSPDIRYTRNASGVRGIPASAVQSIVDKAVSGLTSAPEIHVVQSVSELDTTILDDMKRQNVLDEDGNADVQGVSYRGKVWLVCDNIDSVHEAAQILAHELTHDGLGTLLNKNKDASPAIKSIRHDYNSLMYAIYQAHKKEVRAIARTTHTHLDLSTIKGCRQAAEEWLCNQAYEAQPKWYDKLVAVFHDLLRAMGIDVKLSDAEVRTVLQDAFRQFEGKNGDIRYSRKQAEEPVNYEPSKEEAQKVQSAIEGKTIEEAVQFIIDTAPEEAQRIIAGRVLSRIGDMQKAGVSFELSIAHDRDRVPQQLKGARGITYTEPGWNKVQIWLQGADVTGYVGTSYDTLLHETIHAVTQATIESGRLGNVRTQAAYRELLAVSKTIAAHLKGRIGANDLTELEKDILQTGDGINNFLQSPDEILAYGLSSKKFQDYLETIPYKNETLWSRFVNSIRSALGLSSNMDTALSGILRAGESFFDINQDWVPPVKMDTINIKKGELLNESIAGRQEVHPQEDIADKEETKMDAFTRTWQNHMKAFDTVRDALRKSGKLMSELTDVSRYETLAHSKTANALQRFMSHAVDPLIKDIAGSHWTMDEVEDYATMRHVPEANAHLAKLHNDPDATANGITTEQAEKSLSEYESKPHFEELKALADRMNAISDESLDIQVKSGILSEESRTTMKQAYEHYVPLRGGDIKQGTGKGMRVSGKMKRRAGHGERQEFILENIIKQREGAVRQANKNEASLSVLKFIMEADDPRIGTIGKPEKHATFRNKTAYMVESKEGATLGVFDSDSAAFQYIGKQGLTGNAHVVQTKQPAIVMQASPIMEDNEICAYIQGHQIRMQINHEGLARAATNEGIEQLNTILSAGRKFNRYLSSVYTQYNPEFAARNLVRDFTAGVVNLTGDYGLGMTAKVVANYPKAVYELIRSSNNYLKSKVVKEYGEDGGQIGSAWLPSLEQISTDLESSYHEYLGTRKAFAHAFDVAVKNGQKPERAFLTATMKTGSSSFKHIPLIGHFLKLVERVNMLSENSFRLATYMTLRKNKIGRAEAAEASKDVTLNFDRRGELSTQAGALYLFFNPAVQGVQRSYFALTQSKHKYQAQALVGMMIGAGFLVAMGSGKDDWDKINRGVKSRSLAVAIGGKQFATIPLPYEYGAFVTMGYAIADVLRGSRSPVEAALDVATAVIDAVVPFGNPMDDKGNITPFQVMPTIAKLGLAPTINENTFGAPLMPRKYTEAKPDSATMWRSTAGTQYDRITKFLNEATGGTPYTKGAIDISPETVRFYVNSLTGGTGQFISKMANLGYLASQGVTPEKRESPFLSSFLRDITPQEARSRFWEQAQKVEAAGNAFSQAKKKGDRDAMLKIQQDHAPLLALAEFADETKKTAKARRDLVESVRLDDNLSLAQKRAWMEQMEQKEEAAYDNFLRVFELRKEGNNQ